MNLKKNSREYNKEHAMIDLIILAGPTGVGKTDVSLKLAKKVNGEIISADSMAVYKYMDIGSAKIQKDKMQGISHHLIDIVYPWEDFNAAKYCEYASKAIYDIAVRGKMPVITGGTGLYISAVIDNYSFTDAVRDDAYRNYLKELSEQHGNEYVHEMLKNIDMESYQKLHPNNLKRVIRALEVYKLTGKTMSEFLKNGDKKKDSPYNIHYYALNMDREKLYERINKRVDKMLEDGLIDEVKKLKEMGCTADMVSMKGIGYKEILYYIDNQITYDDAVYLIKKGSRNYAKRQLTWFRKDKRVMWLNKDELSDDEIVCKIIKNMNIIK